MPAPITPPSFPAIFPVAGARRPAPPAPARQDRTPLLVAVLCLLVAAAFLVDVGVPAEPAAASAARVAALP